MTFLDFCRTANIWLGFATAIAVGYRAVIGFKRAEIAYKPLFVEFVLAMLLVGTGSKVAQNNSAPTSWITAAWTALLVAIIGTCLFYKPKGNR